MEQLPCSVCCKEKKIFIVSGDVHFLAKKWIERSDGKFRPPERQVFDELRQGLIDKLIEVFDNQVEIIFIGWQKLHTQLIDAVDEAKNGMPVISLEHVYSEGVSDIIFDCNRIVGHIDGFHFEDIGKGPRPKKPSIHSQINYILKFPGFANPEDKKVLIVDDGTWSKGTLLQVEQMLEAGGVRVEKFIVGIKINHLDYEYHEDYLTRASIHACYTFGGKKCELQESENVIDWICERDFYPGINYSGKVVGELLSQPQSIFYNARPLGIYTTPYVMPLGDPVKNASIPPEKAVDFSRFCLDQSIKLYTSIERATAQVHGNSCTIKINDLERIPYLLREDGEKGIVKALQEAKEQLL